MFCHCCRCLRVTLFLRISLNLASSRPRQFFGYLFDMRAKAEELYCDIVSRYECNSLAAMPWDIQGFRFAPQLPKVVFASYSDYWKAHAIHAPPYKSRFIHDAGGVFPSFASIQRFKVMHSTIVPEQLSAFKFGGSVPDNGQNLTLFHEVLHQADVIIDESSISGKRHGLSHIEVAEAYKLPPFEVGQTFMAESLDPASSSRIGWSLVSHGVGEKLYELDSQGQLVPNLASSIVRTGYGGDTWEVTLASDRHFSDGSPVTADDVVFSLGRTNTNQGQARASVGRMTLTKLGALKLSIKTEINTPVMPSVLAENSWVIHKSFQGDPLPLKENLVFTGPYAVKAHNTTSGVLHLIPNTHYPNALQRVSITIKRYSTGQAVTEAFKAGEIDMGFNLPAQDVPAFNWAEDVTVKSYAVGYQYMMHFNTKRTKLADKKVRQAIALIIDRPKLAVATAPSGMDVTTSAATSPFPSNTPWGAAHDPLPTDTTEAGRLLDEAGWLVASDGIRTKGGVQLSLDMAYYTFRADLVTMAPIIQQQLAAVGVLATPRVQDDGQFIEGQAGSFDLMLWAQNTLPAGDPNVFLQTFFKTQNLEDPNILDPWASQNFARYSSAVIDDALEVLSPAEGDARAAASKAVVDAIRDEVPVTFLTSATWHVALSNRVKSYEPWGTDYHLIKTTMPESDWPKAFVNNRLFRLDGTMDSRGPPNGGSDWFESRFAEPDGKCLCSPLHITPRDHPSFTLHRLASHASVPCLACL